MISNLNVLSLIRMAILLCLPSPVLGASSTSLRGGHHQEDNSATQSTEALSASISLPESLSKDEEVLDFQKTRELVRQRERRSGPRKRISSTNSRPISPLRNSSGPCANWCKTHPTLWSWCANGEAAGKCHLFDECKGCGQCSRIRSDPCSNNQNDQFPSTCQPWCRNQHTDKPWHDQGQRQGKCSFENCSGCYECNSNNNSNSSGNYGGSQGHRSPKYRCPDLVGNTLQFFDNWPIGKDCSCCRYYDWTSDVDCCVNMQYY